MKKKTIKRFTPQRYCFLAKVNLTLVLSQARVKKLPDRSPPSCGREACVSQCPLELYVGGSLASW